ncbi:unnamed protein product [Nesidiocoris tenuis]|uniref:Uncharacterized protein n=1 Tax=Nesidiocoris tenuis TaxID=355587 RepID=A0A6H5GZG6_9HEMI|nr:unnamed protein product [Nesidiocoris tenuis]
MRAQRASRSPDLPDGQLVSWQGATLRVRPVRLRRRSDFCNGTFSLHDLLPWERNRWRRSMKNDRASPWSFLSDTMERVWCYDNQVSSLNWGMRQHAPDGTKGNKFSWKPEEICPGELEPYRVFHFLLAPRGRRRADSESKEVDGEETEKVRGSLETHELCRRSSSLKSEMLQELHDAGLPSSSSTSCYSCRTHLQTQQQPHARCSLRPCHFQGPSHVLRTHTDARPRTTSTCTAERSILPDGAGWNALLNSEWNDAAKEKDSTHRRDICYLDSPGIGGNFMFLVRRQFHAVLIRSGPNSLGDMMSMEIFENGRYPSQSHSHGRCRNSAKNIKNTERHGYMFDFGDHFGLCFDDSMVTRILLCQQYVKQITQDRTRWLKLIYSGGSTSVQKSSDIILSLALYSHCWRMWNYSQWNIRGTDSADRFRMGNSRCGRYNSCFPYLLSCLPHLVHESKSYIYQNLKKGQQRWHNDNKLPSDNSVLTREIISFPFKTRTTRTTRREDGGRLNWKLRFTEWQFFEHEPTGTEMLNHVGRLIRASLRPGPPGAARPGPPGAARLELTAMRLGRLAMRLGRSAMRLGQLPLL